MSTSRLLRAVRSAQLYGPARSQASSAKGLDISGIYPPITTPFDSTGSIAYPELQGNVTRWSALPFRGIVVHGSTGECVLLSQKERLMVVETVRSVLPDDKLLVVGVGQESTRATVELAVESARAGAQAVLVVTPCFYKGRMSSAALSAHFKEVADSCPVPVILYSVPGNTGVDLPAEVAIGLASHLNVLGMKDSGGDVTKLGYIVHKTKEHGFQVLAGSASFLLPALEVGAVGGICALANTLGAEVCELYEKFLKGDRAEARALQHRLIAPNTAVTKQFGIAGVKASMDWFGYYGGLVRSPLLQLGSDD
ncbi:4-hydroxy-2-oxoglutarate aldolase, mitochondrial [Ixodes scapularis]|uniref:4-hydroxy-2-oxoglutarate aldolase, mitochondrial n=1 Tax=Ixodes scapularis TaxID=6945 RepID=UPI001A9DACD4|nr:4-hydroxy-2-oxoglutarate aldolase, mitochondrial [Ixodes scapularis]